MAARRWTSAQRVTQGTAIRKWEPWRFSTGPRTWAGKANASQNSLKHGCNSRRVRELRAMERRAKRMQSESLAAAEHLERFRLQVSKMVAETASRKGKSKALFTAHRFLALQMARAEANVLRFDDVWCGHPAGITKTILRC